MFWSLIKESIPRQVLVICVLGLIFWLLGWSSLAIIALLLTLELLFFNSTMNSVNDFVYTKDIFNLIMLEGELLRVGMDRGQIKNIKTIQLWQQDQHGYIDFKLNMQSIVRYKFPFNQYHALLNWFEANLPETELETAFKS